MPTIHDLKTGNGPDRSGAAWRVLLVVAVLAIGAGTALGIGQWVNKDAEDDWRRAASQEAGRLAQTVEFALEQSRSSIRGFARISGW